MSANLQLRFTSVGRFTYFLMLSDTGSVEAMTVVLLSIRGGVSEETIRQLFDYEVRICLKLVQRVTIRDDIHRLSE